MFTTPAIPDYIKKIRLEGYTNIFDYRPDCPFPDPKHENLWGTETLCGDWDGKTLIVLKDFAPTNYLNRREDGPPGYRHTADSPTNRSLIELLNSADVKLDQTGDNNTTCGLLYISACFLLKDGDAMSNSISIEALDKSWPAIQFTLDNMPNLTDIVLCGTHAFRAFQQRGLIADRNQALQNIKPTDWKGYRLHTTCHPNPQAVNSMIFSGLRGRQAARIKWKAILDCVRGNTVDQ